MIVTVVPAVAGTLAANQISVVVPAGFAVWAARDQVLLVWLMPDTWLAAVPRVEITATRVLPATGVDVRFTPNAVAAVAPVLPVALCTRAGVNEPDRSPRVPASFASRVALPVNVRSSPLSLLEIVRLAAATSGVAS